MVDATTTYTVSSSTSRAILYFISILDSYGAQEWDLRIVALVSAAILLSIKLTIGRKYKIEWECMIHAFITGWGALMCVYINTYSSYEMTGINEPLRTIQCEIDSITGISSTAAVVVKPLTSLHRLLPAITQGYAICDIINGLSLGSEWLAHGLATFAVMTVFVELDASPIIVPMLVMEISTVILTMIRGTCFTAKQQLVIQASFAVSFFVTRVIYTPISYYEIVTTMYQHQGECYPRFLFYITVLFGAFFNCLNAYWFVKIVKKVRRTLGGEVTKTEDYYTKNE